MIRVTVELVSAVDPSRDRLLGVAHIANDGQCNYKYGLSKWAPKSREVWKAGRVGLVADLEAQQVTDDFLKGEIVAFDNVKRGAWDLLYLVFKAAVGDRNR